VNPWRKIISSGKSLYEMKIWLARNRIGARKILVESKGKYFESSLLGYLGLFNKGNKRKKLILDESKQNFRPRFSFPGYYRHSFNKGLYLEGDIIYYHQLRNLINQKRIFNHRV